MTDRIVWVVAAVLKNAAGQILLAQRPDNKMWPGLWEFPGGKVEPNEHPEIALARELHEELGIEVRAEDLAPLTFASHRYPQFHLVMLVYLCEVWSGEVHPREGQGGIVWAQPEELKDYPMPEADLPLIPLLQYTHRR